MNSSICYNSMPHDLLSMKPGESHPSPTHKARTTVLSEIAYQRLLSACGDSLRDTAIIQLFLQTGMWRSELARLTLTDTEIPERSTIDPENTGIGQVRRKGGAVATIPLNRQACRAPAAYL
jgi:integrase